MASQPFQTSTNMMIAKQEESSQETPKETPPKVEGWGRDYCRGDNFEETISKLGTEGKTGTLSRIE